MDEAHYLKDIINSGKIGILDWNLTQDTILISKTLQNILGYHNTDSGMVKVSITDIISEKDKIAINNNINRYQAENKSDFSMQHCMIHNDGSDCWVLHNGTITFNKHREPIRLVSSIINITDIKVSELESKESESRYRYLFESSHEGILLLDKDHNTILYANDTISKMVNYPIDKLIKMTFNDIAVINIDKKLQELIPIENSIYSNIQLTRSDKSHIYTDINCIKTSIDGTDNYICLIRDITESKNKYHAYITHAPYGIFIVDSEGNYQEVNQSACEMTGFSKSELLTMNIKNLLDPKFLNESLAHFNSLLSEGKMDVISACVDKNGNAIQIAINAVRIDKNRFIGFCQNVTEKLHTEKLLMESEEKFRSFMEQSPISIQIMNPEGKIIQVNSSFMKLWGFSPDVLPEIFEKYNILHDEQAIKLGVMPLIKKAFAGDAVYLPPVEYDVPNTMKLLKFTKIEGRIQWIQSRLYPVKNKDNVITHLIMMSENITESKRAEKKLQESEEKHRLLVEHQTDMIVKVDLDGKFLFVSPSYCKMFGKTENELLGKTFMPLVHKDDRERTAKEMEKLYQPPHSVYIEQRAMTKTGWRWLGWMDTAVFDENGEITTIIGVGRDISKRKQSEKLQDTLYKISEAVNQSNNLENLLISIHNTLGAMIDTTNFYIALYNKESDLYSFPYCVDQYEDSDFTPQQLKKSLTDYVRRTKKPCLVNQQTHEQLIKSGEVKLIGQPSPIWLGVPLKTPNGIIGVVVVQSYDNPDAFTEVDLDIMSFASEQIALAIERKRTEKALKESEEKYRELFDESVAAIYLFDVHKNFIDSNKAGLDLLGYTRDELLKMSIPDVDANPKEVVTAHKNMLAGSDLVNFEHHLKRKDGTIITVLNNSKSYTDSKGNVIAIQSTLLDITKRKQSEKALKESEEKFRAFTNQTTEGITVANLDGKYVFVNPAFCQMSGYSKDELLKMTVFDMTDFDSDTKQQMKIKFSQNLNTIEGVQMNVKLHKKDNTEYFTEIIGKIITIGNEQFALGTIRDITQHLQAEKLLKESEKKYRNLFEIAQEGIWVIDAESRTTLVNKSMTDMLGYTEKEMLGKHLFDFMDKQGIEIATKLIKRRKAGIKEQHDFEFMTKDGNRIITTIETAPIYDDNKKYIGAIAGVIDITDRKTAETALIESKKQYDEILDRSSAVVYVKDLKHKYLYANLKFKNLFNLSMEELYNKTDYDIFPKEVSDLFIKNDMIVSTEQKYHRIHEDVLHEDGIHTYISDKFPLFDSNGKIYATCGISTDISDLLEAQQKEKDIQQQLIRKDRLIHAGHLAAAIAHEINNPMTVLHGSLEEIKDSIEALNDDVIDEMLRMSRRIKKIISNLLIFTSQTEQKKESVDINSIIQNTFLLMSNLLHKSSIEFILDLSKDKLEIEIAQIQIQQVFINIIFNAIHAMKNGGRLKVKSYTKNNNIYISIEDNGIGIAEENLKSIFLPFFTTKDVGEGTGLGLSICHGIIKEHNGSISVTSKVNKGTTFTIILPTS